MTRTLFVSLNIPWDTFGEAAIHAWLERWTHYKNDWQAADPAERTRIEEKIAEGLAYSLAELTTKLHEETLQDSYKALETEFGAIWTVLKDSQEARFLACGHRWLEHAEGIRYAGLELGLAVEQSLSYRVFQPLRETVRETGQDKTIAFDEKDWFKVFGNFLKGKTEHLMLGAMVEVLNRTLSHEPTHLAGAYRLMYDYLHALPNPTPLFSDRVVVKQRSKALENINEWRIRCAHPKEPPICEEELKTMWSLVAGDRQHGFFRYFGAAFIKPDGAGE